VCVRVCVCACVCVCVCACVCVRVCKGRVLPGDGSSEFHAHACMRAFVLHVPLRECSRCLSPGFAIKVVALSTAIFNVKEVGGRLPTSQCGWLAMIIPV